MKVTFVGTTSDTHSCPTIYATERDTYLVQGDRVTDAEALATVGGYGNGIPAHETLVEIPTGLVKYFMPADVRDAVERLHATDEAGRQAEDLRVALDYLAGLVADNSVDRPAVPTTA